MCRAVIFIMISLLSSISLAAPSQIDYLVLGVITSTEKGQGVALLKHSKSGKVMAYKNQSELKGGLKIVEVGRKHVLFEKDKELLKVFVGSDEPQKYQKDPAPKLDLAKSSEGLERVGDHLRIQHRLKEKLLNEDLSTVLMQAATEPFVKDGMIQGFVLWEIEPDSIYDLAGLRNGDLITHINGMPLTDAGNAIQTLKSLKDAKEVDVTYVTAGAEKNLKISVE